jgi:hypothetical protein
MDVRVMEYGRKGQKPVRIEFMMISELFSTS